MEDPLAPSVRGTSNPAQQDENGSWRHSQEPRRRALAGWVLAVVRNDPDAGNAGRGLARARRLAAQVGQSTAEAPVGRPSLRRPAALVSTPLRRARSLDRLQGQRIALPRSLRLTHARRLDTCRRSAGSAIRLSASRP